MSGSCGDWLSSLCMAIASASDARAKINKQVVQKEGWAQNKGERSKLEPTLMNCSLFKYGTPTKPPALGGLRFAEEAGILYHGAQHTPDLGVRAPRVRNLAGAK